jgi:hypothetical protein
MIALARHSLRITPALPTGNRTTSSPRRRSAPSCGEVSCHLTGFARRIESAASDSAATRTDARAVGTDPDRPGAALRAETGRDPRDRLHTCGATSTTGVMRCTGAGRMFRVEVHWSRLRGVPGQGRSEREDFGERSPFYWLAPRSAVFARKVPVAMRAVAKLALCDFPDE